MTVIVVPGEIMLAAIKSEASRALDGFYAYMRRRGRAENTIIRYDVHLRQLIAWLDAQDKSLAELRAHDLEVFLFEWTADFEARNGRAPSPSSQKNAIAALHSFFGWLESREMIDRNPSRVLESPRVPQRRNDWLSPREDQALLDACQTPPECAIIYLLRFSGLRASEAAKLLWADVDFEQGTLRVRESKTERGKRVIPILPELRPELLRWREYQDAVGLGDPRMPVLATKPGTHMNPRHVWRVTKRVAVRADIRPVPDKGGSEISPHTLRRTLGSHLLNRGARLEVVSKLLGHDSTQTTERAYADLLDATVAAEVLSL